MFNEVINPPTVAFLRRRKRQPIEIGEDER